MAGDHGSLKVSYVDSDGETGTLVVPGVLLTAANFDSQVTLQDAIVTAVAAVTNGNAFKTERGNQVITAKTVPSDHSVQREIKWLVQGRDSVTGKVVQIEIPCADLSVAAPYDPAATGVTRLDLTSGVGLALKNALEAYWRAGDSYNHAVVVESCYYVSRRA